MSIGINWSVKQTKQVEEVSGDQVEHEALDSRVEGIKKALVVVGYQVESNDIDEIIEELHVTYGSQRVGASVSALGSASPLYVKSGGVAFLVDNADDLQRACVTINRMIQKSAVAPVVMPKQVKSYWEVDIVKALNHEIEQSMRINRDIRLDALGYTGGSGSAQLIVDDLLSDNKRRNANGAEAFKRVLVQA